MLTATGFRPRRRGLGAISPLLPSLDQPTLTTPTGIDVTGRSGFGPSRGTAPVVPPIIPPTAPVSPTVLKNYFLTAAIGPTAGGTAPDAPSRPPPATAPSNTAVTVTSGGSGYVPSPVTTTPVVPVPPMPTPQPPPPSVTVPTSTQPSATSPTATVVAPAGGARSWWPWAIGAAVVAVIGGVLLHHHG